MFNITHLSTNLALRSYKMSYDINIKLVKHTIFIRRQANRAQVVTVMPAMGESQLISGIFSESDNDLDSLLLHVDKLEENDLRSIAPKLSLDLVVELVLPQILQNGSLCSTVRILLQFNILHG